MHASSIENMRRCYRRYVKGGALEARDEVLVLDLGGADVNGSYRSIFEHSRYRYTAADLAEGPGVSLVLQDPYRLPFDDGSLDIILCGQMLEHCEYFWLAFAEMVRVIRPNGLIFLIAPSAGPEHRFPVDCYRFYPDAFRALAKHAGCCLLEVWRDERGPWFDLVGVFSRQPQAFSTATDMAALQRFDGPPGSPEEETRAGTRDAREVLADLHRTVQPRAYLEIGIRHGRSLALAKCPAVGIDPAPELKVELPASAQVVTAESDEFFRDRRETELSAPVDLALIDGLHLFEQALRDFMYVERIASPQALIVIDDVFPNHAAQAERERRTQVWTGDVWKLTECLGRLRPDLFLLPLNASYTGQLLIAGLNPRNRTLWDRYNKIIKPEPEATAPPPSVLARRGAAQPSSALLERIGGVLAKARAEDVEGPELVRRLRSAAGAAAAEQKVATGAS